MASLESSDKKMVAVSDSPTAEVAELAHLEAQLSTKEQLSAYFTIAAAAFGLISDGCEYDRTELHVYRANSLIVLQIKTIL